MSRLSNFALLAALVGGALVTSQANAAGFEKANMWGGKEASMSSAVAPTISGSNAIYFNPAGLVTKPGNSFSVNVSPTSSQFKGPINNLNTENTSETATSFPFGLTYGHSEEEYAYGVGAYVSAGNSVDYGSVDFQLPTTYKPSIKTSISIVEFAAGGAYKVNDDLKLGLAWRVLMAQAEFAFATRTALVPQGIINTKLTDLKDTQYVAFKAGAQYKLTETMDMGLTFRSEVNFDAKGTASGQISSGASASGAANPALVSAEATAHTTLPMQIALGVSEKFSDDWNFAAQYEWTQYSRVGSLTVDGTTFATTGNKTSIVTDWRDQHALRLGAEYKTAPWPVRFGYTLSSAVTNPDYARATFTAPGMGHSLVVGTGTMMSMGAGENNLSIDGTFEYSFTNGDVSGKAASGTTGAGTDTRNGSYSASGLVAHLGATYAF
jgi:long-subunit fatty acid transport protein